MTYRKPVILVCFSCGAASAVAAKRTVELYSQTHTIRIINNPVAQEDEDNQRFLRDVERWINHPIEHATHPKYPTGDVEKVWDDEKYMSGINGAPCTKFTKKFARQIWENNTDYSWERDFIVMGFTADEERRSRLFAKTERPNLIPILINEGLTKDDCFRIVTDAGLTLPRIYYMGYPNANCIGCVKATSPTYWNHVRKMHPAVFWQRALQSRKLGVRLVRYKGKRIFLDELPADAKGQSMKSMKMPECGIFCEAVR